MTMVNNTYLMGIISEMEFSYILSSRVSWLDFLVILDQIQASTDPGV